MGRIKPVEILDLKDVPCPLNSARVLLKIAGMAEGEILEAIVDDGEPFVNVCASVEEEGYEIVEKNRTGDSLWHLYIKAN